MTNGAISARLPPQFGRWLAARTRRERGILAALAALLVTIVVWFGLWQPLQRDLATLSVTVPAEHRALAGARKMADEMAALARNPAPRRTADPRAELERIAAERGLRAAITEQSWQDERVRLVFADVTVDALVRFLEALTRDTALLIVEATLTARVEPGTVRAEITLSR
jgi:type II secretory pathway component PulM